MNAFPLRDNGKPGRPLLGLVGPCAAGKSTLIHLLDRERIVARHIAQEHSYVKDMWLRLTNPVYLVYLEVSFPLTLARRTLDWTEADYKEQVFRLRHARENAHLIIDTDPLTPEQVLEKILDFVAARRDVVG